MSSAQVPYHRQFAKGPTIFVRNGFLDTHDGEDGGGAWAAADARTQERLQRAKSSPAALVDLGSAYHSEDDLETEAESDAPGFQRQVSWASDSMSDGASVAERQLSCESSATAPTRAPSPQPSPRLSPHAAPQLSPQLAPQLSPECLRRLVPRLARLPSAAEDTFVQIGEAPRLQAHTVSQAVSAVSGLRRVLWTVDAGKLQGHERQAVSPFFEIPLGGQTASFRLVVIPRAPADVKGSASFKKAGGRGCVQVKCEVPRGLVSFWVSVTDGRGDFPRRPRGPIAHDFAWQSTCGLPKDQELWDFREAVDRVSQTFTICLEILPHADI